MALGHQIKKYRTFHQWTLEDLSERSGVEVGTIGALEVRDSQRSAKAPQLAKALGLSVEQLLDEEKDWSTVAAVHVITAEVEARERALSNPVEVREVHEIRPPDYPPRQYWPFTVTIEECQRLLNADDHQNISYFLRGILVTRETEVRKSSRAK